MGTVGQRCEKSMDCCAYQRHGGGSFSDSADAWAMSLNQERAWVEIDLRAIADNIRQLRRLLRPQTDLMAVVKADAYGHGAVAVAHTALGAGASWLGVATVMEGIELRRSGITAPIVLLGAVQSATEVQAIAHWQLQPTLSSAEQVRRVARVLAGLDCEPLCAHLKLDTGMTRLGVPWQDALAFVAQVQACPQLQIASLYSHLATADDPDLMGMRLQQQRYEAALAQLREHNVPLPRLHLANSAATLRADPSLQYDMVRVGLAIYGLYPSAHLQDSVPLRPALQVRARVTQVKQILPGTGVSYGHRFVASQEMRVAVVAIGYADGLPRSLSGQVEVLWGDRRLPQLGAITMDQIIVDVSSAPEIAPGATVTLLGGTGLGGTGLGGTGLEETGSVQISADDWAAKLGTISWEVLCGFKHRLPRVFLPAAESVSVG